MSKRHYPYGRQTIDQSDIDHVVRVLRSDYLTTGPAIETFEEDLCAYTGAGHAVAVSSGTAALHAAYHGAGLGPGDEVITSPLTFTSTANAALFLGATVRFVDVDAQTGLIDPAGIESAITKRTRLIVPVDYAGIPADYDRINAIAKQHGLAVIADGAHSLGASYHGRHVGVLADATATSFHPVKPITTAEGGAVLTNDNKIHQRAAAFRTHGITRDAKQFTKQNTGPWFYEMHELGYNYRLSDLHAALGISQIRKIDQFIARRRAIAGLYDQMLGGIDGLTVPARVEGVESGWHLYVIRVANATRRGAFFEKLKSLHVGVQVHYIPVYYHPYYQGLGYRKGLCPVAEDFYDRCVSLPIYPSLTDDDVACIADRVRQAAGASL